MPDSKRRTRRPLSAAAVLAVLATGSHATAAAVPARAPTFKRGISIGHWLAKMHDGEPYGAPSFSRNDVVWIAQRGFDHIRLPVDGRLWWLADGSLDEAKVAPFVQALEWARESGMGAVLDMHFLPSGAYDPNSQDLAVFTDAASRRKASTFWNRIARRFAREGPYLRFELINEPMAPRNEQLNTLNAALLAAIRESDRERVVYVTSNQSSAFATLDELAIPDDPKVAMLVHYDEPAVFTHQRASWKLCPPDMPLVLFPGKVPDMSGFVPPGHFAAKASLTELKAEDVDAAFAEAAAWLARHAPGKEVYLGEFGVYEAAPAESRRTYIATVRAAAERHGWGWAVWDYRSSFAVRAPDGTPTPVLEGLFPAGPPGGPALQEP